MVPYSDIYYGPLTIISYADFLWLCPTFPYQKFLCVIPTDASYLFYLWCGVFFLYGCFLCVSSYGCFLCLCPTIFSLLRMLFYGALPIYTAPT